MDCLHLGFKCQDLFEHHSTSSWSMTCINSRQDDPLCFKAVTPSHIILDTTHHLLISPTFYPASPKSAASSTALHHQISPSDMFTSRKRDREDGEDSLQHYAPDAKVSAFDCFHKHRVADKPNRDQLCPSVPLPIPDIPVPSHSHETDLHLSLHKPSRPQTLQRRRIHHPSNLQINPIHKIVQPLAPLQLFKETKALTQIWTWQTLRRLSPHDRGLTSLELHHPKPHHAP